MESSCSAVGTEPIQRPPNISTPSTLDYLDYVNTFASHDARHERLHWYLLHRDHFLQETVHPMHVCDNDYGLTRVVIADFFGKGRCPCIKADTTHSADLTQQLESRAADVFSRLIILVYKVNGLNRDTVNGAPVLKPARTAGQSARIPSKAMCQDFQTLPYNTLGV